MGGREFTFLAFYFGDRRRDRKWAITDWYIGRLKRHHFDLVILALVSIYGGAFIIMLFAGMGSGLCELHQIICRGSGKKGRC
jgi:hypothetical protein